jgi:hemolysin D
MNINNDKQYSIDDKHNHNLGIKSSTEVTDIQKISNQKIKVNRNQNPPFDQSVILTQSRSWSRALLWILMCAITGTVIWANIAKIEEAISAQGKLEPTHNIKEVQAPIGGVVKEVFVEDGQKVKAGEKLLSLDPTTVQSQLTSLQKIRASLVEEKQLYQSQIQTKNSLFNSSLLISKEVFDLSRNRAALVAENELYRAQIGRMSLRQLSLEQRERLLSQQAELNSRLTTEKLEIDQSKRQINQIDIRINTINQSLMMNQGISNDLKPLVETGAISKIQFFKQEQEVNNLQSQIQQLSEEKGRLKSTIAQTESKLETTIATSHNELLEKIAHNNKQVAEIDSQFTKAIIENNKRIAEIDSQISEVETNLKYKEIKAPSNGTIFALKPHTPGFVVTSSEPILKVVPDDGLIAQVYITNKDIGFVKEGMDVDVRIDSFPYSEFGDIKGKLIWVGSDILAPDQINPYYRFPAKVHLAKQSISVKGRDVSLQSGMSVSVNLKLRERTVMSIFTDVFSQSLESFKSLR